MSKKVRCMVDRTTPGRREIKPLGRRLTIGDKEVIFRVYLHRVMHELYDQSQNVRPHNHIRSRYKYVPRVITVAPKVQDGVSQNKLHLSVSFAHVEGDSFTIASVEDRPIPPRWEVNRIHTDLRQAGCILFATQQSHVIKGLVDAKVPEFTRFTTNLLETGATLVFIVEPGLRKPEFLARYSAGGPELFWERSTLDNYLMHFTKDGKRPLTDAEEDKIRLDGGNLRLWPTQQMVTGEAPLLLPHELPNNQWVTDRSGTPQPYLIQVKLSVNWANEGSVSIGGAKSA